MPEKLTVDRNTAYPKSIILHAVTLVVTIINHAPHSSRTEDKIYPLWQLSEALHL
jgi:hypothetical protein